MVYRVSYGVVHKDVKTMIEIHKGGLSSIPQSSP